MRGKGPFSALGDVGGYGLVGSAYGPGAPWFRWVRYADGGGDGVLHGGGLEYEFGWCARRLDGGSRCSWWGEHSVPSWNDEIGLEDAGVGNVGALGYEVCTRELRRAPLWNGSCRGGRCEDGGGKQTDGADVYGCLGRCGSLHEQGAWRGSGGTEG